MMVQTISNPHAPLESTEIEESLLGGLLFDPNALLRVMDLLDPNDFYLSSHRKIYSAAIALNRNGTPCDLLTIANYLSDKKEIEAVGGMTKLSSLFDRTVSAINIDRYAVLIQQKSLRRRLKKAAQEIETLAHQTELEISDVIGEAERKILGISALQQGGGDLHEISEVALGLLSEMEKGEEPEFISTGFLDLDNLLGGFNRSDLIVLAARPSMGKTALSLQIAAAVARQGLPVGIFSLEMSKEQLTNRLISSEAQIPGTRLKAKKLLEKEVGPYVNAIATIGGLPIFINESGVDVRAIASHCRKIKAEKDDLGLIMIDYLQLMNIKGDNPNNELSKITRQLKLLAKELDVPILLLSQLSRGVESRTNKRPVLSDLRDSGAIEQDADIVIFLYREEYYDPETPRHGIAEAIVNKNRNGEVGTIELLFQREYVKFQNLAKIGS